MSLKIMGWEPMFITDEEGADFGKELVSYSALVLTSSTCSDMHCSDEQP